MKSNSDIIWLDSIDSTNNEARRLIDSLDNLSVLSAVSQTKGRGQRENIWLSEPGKNLLFSIVLKYSRSYDTLSSALPSVQAHDQIVISQIASLSIIDLLASHEIEAKIKLPNDIYVGDKKICGILIEHTVLGKWLTSSIIGIGLNINQRNFDVNLPNPISMVLCKEDSDNDYDIRLILEEFMTIFYDYLDRFCHITGGYNRLDRLFKAQIIK